jgi:hypothetical protein
MLHKTYLFINYNKEDLSPIFIYLLMLKTYIGPVWIDLFMSLCKINYADK